MNYARNGKQMKGDWVLIKVGIAGFGWWGRHIADRLSGHSGFDVVAVADPNAAVHGEISALGARPVAGLDEILAMDQINAVILTSPNELHDSQIMDCVHAGVHVFCEKPLSLTAAGARESVAACAERGLVLGIGHERRFEPAIQALKTEIDAGSLGTVMHSELAFSHNKLKDLPPTSWRTTKQFAPAAGMTQMGIHLTDLLIWFFGPVDSVHAIAADRELHWETGDIVVAQMQFRAGMTAQIQAILNTPHFLRTHVFGSREWIEIRNATHPDTPGGEVRMVRYRDVDDQDCQTFSWTDSVIANLDNFAAAVRGDQEYLFSDFEKVHNIEVLDAIVRSVERGEVVRV